MAVRDAFGALFRPLRESCTGGARVKVPIRGEGQADILLVLCPPWDVDYPPLGIAYLSTYLKRQGMSAHVLDANIYLYNALKRRHEQYWSANAYENWANKKEFAATLEVFDAELNRLARAIAACPVPCVGFSVNFSNKFFTIELMRRVKRLAPAKKFILGGYCCTNENMRGFFPGDLVDVFVVGEGEITLSELIVSLRETGGFRSVAGAIVKENGVFLPFVPRKPVASLDLLPFPTFEEFYLDSYKCQRGVAIITSRGCISRCTFCNDHVMTAPYRFRSAEHVLEEILYHVKENKRTHFAFKDLLCNGNPRELGRLCDLIAASGVQISWDSQAIPKKDLTRGLLEKMKASGCELLIFGLESCSNAVLSKMGKLFTKEDAREVLVNSHGAGINTMVNIIVGFPGESEDDFRQTLDFLSENREYITRISNLSMCLVNNDSDLDLRPGRYGITLPPDIAVRAREWTDASGNCLELRWKRLAELKRLVSMIGLGYVFSNAEGNLRQGIGEEKPVSTDWRNLITHDLLEEERGKREDKVIKGILDGVRAFVGPEIVQFDVTNRCNNTCLCCWNRSPLKKTLQSKLLDEELPGDLAIKTIKDLAKLGTKTLFFAGGGEPFKHPEFMRILATAKSCGMKTIINTNFSLIDEDMIEKIVELKVDFIHASLLAGNPDVYGAMHPGKPAEEFNRIKKMLIHLADVKEAHAAWSSPHVNIYYVICNRNFHQIGPMVDAALEVRATSLEFVPVDVLPGETDELLLTEAQRDETVAAVRREMERLKELQRQFKTPITFIEQGELFIKRMSAQGAVSGVYEADAIPGRACYVGWAFSRIAADGSVYPCLKADRYPVGNIHQDSFGTIWNGQKQRFFRMKTLEFNTSDPFFQTIGNNRKTGMCGCLASCDNIQINRELGQRLERKRGVKC